VQFDALWLTTSKTPANNKASTSQVSVETCDDQIAQENDHLKREVKKLEFEVNKLKKCDSTTSEMRGLSPKIILGDSRRSENTQTHIIKDTVPNMKFKLKLLQIKCHVLGFTKDKAQKVLQRIIRVFVETFISHDRHTLFTLEESDLLRRPTPMGPSRKPSPHRSGSSTAIPHRRHRMEEDPHLHTDK
jgi:hypothetical protein